MTTDKQHKILNVPPLRFPEFNGEWERTALGKCSSPLEYGMNAAAKVFDGENKYIRITDIDEDTQKYNKDDVVSPDGELEDKYLVKDNDILFARTGASTGKTYYYDKRDGKLYFAGFLIRANINSSVNSKFVFYQTQLTRYKKWVGIMSIRSGQPGINAQEYESYKLYLPTIKEQAKIVEFLTLLDERIETQNKIIDNLESLISGITHRVCRDKALRRVMLSDILTEREEKNSGNHAVHSVSVSEGVINQIDYLGRSFAAKDTKNYNVVQYGDIVYTKSPTGSFPYGIVKQSYVKGKVAVSPLYGVYEPINFNVGFYLHHCFSSPIYTTNYLHKLIQKGAKNTINITNQRFLENYISLPSQEILDQYVALVGTITIKLENEKHILAKLTEQKNYLLSQMFI